MILAYSVLAAFAVDLALTHVLVGAIGETAAGIGTLFVGVAATIGAIASTLNGRKINAAKDKAVEAADLATVSADHSAAAAANSAEAVLAIGPANGQTLRAMLEGQDRMLDTLQAMAASAATTAAYQQTRNHDIIGYLGTILAAQPTEIRLIEQLIPLCERLPELCERLIAKIEEMPT